MNIREDAKKIVRYLLKQAEENDNLFWESETTYGELAEDSGIGGAKRCHICVQYLKRRDFVKADAEGGTVLIRLEAAAVDFLEADI